ncbi:MAG: ABC transporter transmembrane domain-containing protein [Oenococcus sp.]|uniref:ABC transporter transmembrane domain-containing protein n=1 Tax=Oenococcus sp. TaxID=1979414 RepID=UPI0039ED4437
MTLKTIFSYVFKERYIASLVTLLMIICSALRVAHALVNALILTSLVAGKLRQFLSYILLDAAIFLVLCLLLVVTQYLRAKAVEMMAIDLRRDISQNLIAMPYPKYMSQDTGTYTSWLTNDMNLIERNGFDHAFDCVQVISDPLLSV